MINNVYQGENYKVNCWATDVESSAIQQLKNTASLPKGMIHMWLSAMPDVHFGKGATVGSVIPLIDSIIPAAVGVDIGCGMLAFMTNLHADDVPKPVLDKLYDQLMRDVPTGKNSHNTQTHKLSKYRRFAFIREAEKKDLIDDYEPSVGRWIDDKNKGFKRAEGMLYHQIGTLGGGNHFIEICLDASDRVWVMLHSGSRNIGKHIGETYITMAKKACEKWKIKLPDPDLAYFPKETEGFVSYVKAVEWAQRYAYLNRQEMADVIYSVMAEMFPGFECIEEVVNTHHNYISLENHFKKNVYVTRKGAIRVRDGELGIIPGSMGAKSFIVRGKNTPGNKLSFNSCSHGAGRKMSRSQAKKEFTLEDFKKQTEGVVCAKSASLVDEIPGAYKDIETVMKNQEDLIDVVHTLKQILCIKGF